MIIKVEQLSSGRKGVREVDLSEVESALSGDINDILDTVFSQGQNEVQNQDKPSVSVGDVIEYDGFRYLICVAGFYRLTDNEYTEFKGTDCVGRLMYAMRTRNNV